MNEFYVNCDNCKKQTIFKYPTRATLVCSSCGCPTGQIFFTEELEEDNTIVFECIKCKEGFPVRLGISSLLKCRNMRCGWSIVGTVQTMTLSNIFVSPTNNFSDIIVSSPRSERVRESKEDRISIKMAMPYFSCGPRAQKAVNSWILPETTFVLTDVGVIPPGSGVCNQIFTSKNAKVDGLSNRTKPYLIDVFSKLLKLFPDEDYYGYVNTDIILPLGVPVRSLIPRKGKNIAFHHRKEFEGKPETPISKLEEKYQTFCGKDVFICDRKTALDIVNIPEDLVLGAACWDNGLAIWCMKKYGADKVDLRYGEIWHQLHDPGWTYEEKDTLFNIKQLEKVGIPTPIRNSVNWTKIYSGPTESDLDIKKLGIIQPGRIGDIIIVLPIAKWYYDRGHEIRWPVPSEYMELFEYINYVHAIDIGPGLSNSYDRSRIALSEQELDSLIDLGIGFGKCETDWAVSKLSFDEWKYKEAGVPFEERFNLKIQRNYQKELNLEAKLGLENKGEFSITHSVGTNGSVKFDAPNSVEIKPISGFTVFDWIGIIESCVSVHCVDSCISHLVNQLGLAKGRRHFKPFPSYVGRAHGKLTKPKIDWKNEKREPVDCIGLYGSSKGIRPDLDDKDVGKGIPPIHFFTIVLNGMPFIEYHINMLKELPYDWHWHIVEGVADPTHSSSWTSLKGGRIDDSFHKNGLSKDGTTEYLNKLVQIYPDQVSLYRKREGKFWQGKVEMVNAPIEYLPNYCFLWEMDVDEFWDKENVIKMADLFQKNPNKMMAFVPGHFFVGPNRFITSQDTWATRPEDNPRIFRFFKGMHWKKHTPATLVNSNGTDLGRLKPLTKREVREADISFQHFAYAIPEQAIFKEVYYGDQYKGALGHWLRLQSSTESQLNPALYLPWARPAIAEIWDETVHGPLLFKGGKNLCLR